MPSRTSHDKNMLCTFDACVSLVMKYDPDLEESKVLSDRRLDGFCIFGQDNTSCETHCLSIWYSFEFF